MINSPFNILRFTFQQPTSNEVGIFVERLGLQSYYLDSNIKLLTLLKIFVMPRFKRSGGIFVLNML